MTDKSTFDAINRLDLLVVGVHILWDGPAYASPVSGFLPDPMMMMFR